MKRILEVFGVSIVVVLVALTSSVSSATAQEQPPVNSSTESDATSHSDGANPDDQDETASVESQEDMEGSEGTTAPDLTEREEGSPIEEPQLAELFNLKAQPIAGTTTAAWVEQPNQRISGHTLYDTAAVLSQQAYPDGASTVLIATGRNYPDALSASALGAKLHAPLLLSDTRELPATTAQEITRLQPDTIVMIGGPAALSEELQAQLGLFAPNVTRVSGWDLYDTSVAIARSGWRSSSEVFVATGLGFADALSAGAAAGAKGIPVVLVPGTSATAPSSVLALLKDLGVSKVYIAGGTAVVGPQMQVSLGASGRTVVRYAGMTQFDTSAEIARQAFEGPRDTYWATGLGFADALTGAAVAGAQGVPLLLVSTSCVPTSVYRANDQLSSGQTYLLGGEAVLTEEVRLGNECMVRPSGSTEAEWAGTQKLYTSINRARFQAGLSGFRLADAAYGTPAYNWSRSLKAGEARLNPALDSQQPWAAYQTVASTTQAGDKAARLGALLLSDTTARSWLLKPSAGVRGAFSVGYAVSGSNGYATIIVGSNLK